MRARTMNPSSLRGFTSRRGRNKNLFRNGARENCGWIAPTSSGHTATTKLPMRRLQPWLKTLHRRSHGVSSKRVGHSKICAARRTQPHQVQRHAFSGNRSPPSRNGNARSGKPSWPPRQGNTTGTPIAHIRRSLKGSKSDWSATLLDDPSWKERLTTHMTNIFAKASPRETSEAMTATRSQATDL